MSEKGEFMENAEREALRRESAQFLKKEDLK